MSSRSRNQRAGHLILLAIAAAVAAMTLGISSHPALAAGDTLGEIELPDVAPPRIDDSISAAELEDLEALAVQKGMSLDVAIDRYGWNDNFALAVSVISGETPGAFAGAEIVNATTAWVAFAGRVPDAALRVVDTFRRSHPGVAVEIRTDIGFTDVQVQSALEAVHFAIAASPTVEAVSSSFNYETGEIANIVVVDDTLPDSALEELRAGAINSLSGEGLSGLFGGTVVTVERSIHPVLGGRASNTEHLGGEALSTCTSAFGTINAGGTRGISTAGHCPNSQNDDGAALTYQTGHEGTHGDFQWHTGPRTKTDDFYAGNATTLEVTRRDVSGVGAPVVGGTLCKNGKTTFRYCEEVRRLNICFSGLCNLIEMDTRSVLAGDSGGAVYNANTAYGVVYGWHYAPVFPFDRDLYSRADRIDNALNVNIATN